MGRKSAPSIYMRARVNDNDSGGKGEPGRELIPLWNPDQQFTCRRDEVDFAGIVRMKFARSVGGLCRQELKQAIS